MEGSSHVQAWKSIDRRHRRSTGRRDCGKTGRIALTDHPSCGVLSIRYQSGVGPILQSLKICQLLSLAGKICIDFVVRLHETLGLMRGLTVFFTVGLCWA